ncbi:MAG: SIMPL domain-containing protein [Microcoleaceae cyanobacterium]
MAIKKQSSYLTLGKTWKIIIPLFLAVSAINLTTCVPLAIAQEQRMKTITVTGQGIVSIPTTMTQIQLGVEAQGKTAQEVQQVVAQRSAKVVELLKSRNVEKLQTTGISLNPIYNYQNNQQNITGYMATNTVSFRVKTATAGNILDEAVQAGASQINGVSFIASDNDIAIAQEQALRQATQEAQAQANIVLGALNLTSKGIANVQINSINRPMPRPLMVNARVAKMDAAPAVTPVEGGEQEIEASVTLAISY